ncbi:MAG: hypothetical protein K8I29_07225 [Alphaproteobacteria bacterium]|uniref:Uncharacterized protein n=1 Tax=Candidatus Nitrobium versatile TaxID=2884831 RepID=A0A953J5G6_9BACT|nr:hypothetical protein [Candidatus Nitrobium versatile]
MDTYFEKKQAEDLAAGSRGVSSVVNNLLVDDETATLTLDMRQLEDCTLDLCIAVV